MCSSVLKTIHDRTFSVVIFLLMWFNFRSRVGIWWIGRHGAEGLSLAPVYWNSSNPLFKLSTISLIIEVQLRDEIDFVCPYDPSNGTDPSTPPEYYVIYQVSKAEYDNCMVNTSDRCTVLLVNCNAPDVKRRFTVIFEPYQSIPNVPEYKPGMTYYYITTSTGTKDGLANTANGACRDQNMKLAFYVCCATTVSSTIPQSNDTLTPLTSSSPTTSLPILLTRDSGVATSTSEISRLQVPTSSIQTTNATKTTSATTSSQNFDASATYIKTLDKLATTKLAEPPQRSYQLTSAGCCDRRTSSTIAETFISIFLFLVPYFSRTL